MWNHKPFSIFFDIFFIILSFSRFEQTDKFSSRCKNEAQCIGGLGRIKTEIDEIMMQKPDSLLLNAGDNFQGTLYYNIFKYNITARFLNNFPFDAIVSTVDSPFIYKGIFQELNEFEMKIST